MPKGKQRPSPLPPKSKFGFLSSWGGKYTTWRGLSGKFATPLPKAAKNGVGNSTTDSTALLSGGIRQVSSFGQEYSCLMLWRNVVKTSAVRNGAILSFDTRPIQSSPYVAIECKLPLVPARALTPKAYTRSGQSERVSCPHT